MTSDLNQPDNGRKVRTNEGRKVRMKGRKNVRRKIGQTDATKEGRIKLRTEGSWAGKKDNVHRKEGMKRGWTDGRKEGK